MVGMITYLGKCSGKNFPRVMSIVTDDVIDDMEHALEV
jgi:hypothetical protein